MSGSDKSDARELARGESDGRPWVFRGEIRSDCAFYEFESWYGGGRTYVRLPHDAAGGRPLGLFGTFSWSTSSVTNEGQLSHVAGVVDAGAAEVVIDTTAEPVKAQVFPAHADVAFFLALLLQGVDPVALRALDARGVELERKAIRRY